MRSSGMRRALLAIVIVGGVVALALMAARSKRPAGEEDWSA